MGPRAGETCQCVDSNHSLTAPSLLLHRLKAITTPYFRWLVCISHLKIAASIKGTTCLYHQLITNYVNYYVSFLVSESQLKEFASRLCRSDAHGCCQGLPQLLTSTSQRAMEHRNRNFSNASLQERDVFILRGGGEDLQFFKPSCVIWLEC